MNWERIRRCSKCGAGCPEEASACIRCGSAEIRPAEPPSGGKLKSGNHPMRRLRPQPKRREKVQVPDDLRTAMRAVLELIEEAKRDEAIRIDFDDAIQVGSLCGGRRGTERRPYEFRYRPEGEPDNRAWDLRLHYYDIEDIADGRTTEMTMYCCASPRCSMSNVDKVHCDCDYVDDPDFGSFEFPFAADRLFQRGIRDLHASSTKEDVLSALGAPSATGGGSVSEKGARIQPWIKYMRADCQLHFSFDDSGTIRTVSIMPPDWRPGK